MRYTTRTHHPTHRSPLRVRIRTGGEGLVSAQTPQGEITGGRPRFVRGDRANNLKCRVAGGGQVEEKLVVRDRIRKLYTAREGGRGAPRAQCSGLCVTAATEQESWPLHCEERAQGSKIAVQSDVHAPQPITREYPRARTDDHCLRLVALGSRGNNWREQHAQVRVCQALPNRKVDVVVLAGLLAGIACAARSGKEAIAVPVQRDAQHPVCGVEGLLHARSVACVKVDEEHALKTLEQIQRREHGVVDIREAGSAVAPRVGLTAGPVDRDV
eukprot:scaffold30422_cov30-Tisochrysis_lutea.AAC.2